MRSKGVNFWNLAAWIAVALAAGGVVWAGVSGPVNTISETGTAIPSQLGKNAGPGKVLQLPTGTDQRGAYWTTIKTLPEGAAPGDVPQVTTTGTNTGWGVANFTGTTNYIPKKTASGWGDSQVSDDGSSVRVGGGSSFAKFSANGSIQASGAAVIADPSAGMQAAYYIADGISRIWSFANASGYGLSYYQDGGSHPGGVTGDSICFHFGSQTNPPYCVKSDGSIYSAGGLTLAGLPGLGVGNVLYVSSSGGVISAKSLTATDVGAEPTLPACAPGQVPQYTGTGTGVTTAKGCGTLTGSAVSFSTATPLTVGTSGSVGTSTLLNRSDHRHAFDGKIPPYSGQTPQFLKEAFVSTQGTITFAEGSGLVNVNANLGSTSGTVAAGNDSRFGLVSVASGYTMGYLYDRVTSGDSTISVANSSGMLDLRAVSATPKSHGNTHNPGGTDAPSAFTNTPGVNKVATLTAAGQNLDGWTTATATPGASVIAKSNASGNLNSWLSVSADPFTNTPGVGKVAALTSAGQTLNGWVTGILVNSEVVTSSSDYWTSAGEGWSSGPSYTFTSNGTRLNVTVEVTISPSVDIAGRGFCALTIVADNGSSASTQRGRETFLRIISGDVVLDVPTSGYYMVGSLSNHANFTLGSTGQTTITVRMYQGGAFTRCTVLSGYLKMYVDVYK